MEASFERVKPMSNHRYIIWDFDGTLGERTGMWSGTLLEVLHANGHGKQLAAKDLRPFLAAGFRWHNAHSTNPPRTSPDLWWSELEPIFQRAFLEGAKVPLAESQHLAREVRRKYVDPAKWTLFSDASQTLGTLAEDGWQHILLTNHVPELTSLLAALSIHRYFTAVFNSADTGIEKPHVQAFENVRSSLTGHPTLWMIGDSFTADVEGAESAGIPAILVRRRHPSAKRYAEDLHGVRSILDG